MTREFLLNKIGALYQSKKEMIKYDQSTGDIIQEILNANEKYKDQYNKISSYFKGYNVRQTCKNIFDFLKQNILYRIESEESQYIRSAAAILKNGVSDCKCYSLWSAGILQSLGIPFCFRFTSYRMNQKQPQHVFVVAYPGTNNEIWIDAVLNTFDYKKPYTYKLDKKPRNMAIYSISGIGATNKKNKFVTKLKKGVKGVIKVAAAPARNAFLELVKLNVHGLGNKVFKLWQKNQDKLKNFWGSIGGRIDILVKNAEKGNRKKRILGYESQSIGSIAALIASAAPIIAKITQILKEAGIKPEELVDVAKLGIQKKAKELISNQVEQIEEVQQKYMNEAEADYQ
jgi:hypothetical protein